MKRGNFDLVTLSPDAISAATPEEFAKGLITPEFVIEIGLNYGLKHLKNDHDKLQNSICRHAYLIHLAHPHHRWSKKVYGQLNEFLGKAACKAAVVGEVRGIGRTYKHLADSNMQVKA